MGKVVIFLILSAFIQISLLLFAGTGQDVGLVGDDGNSTTTITDLITDPQSWYDNPFYILLTASLGLFAASATILVTGFLLRNERVIFLGIGAIFVTFIIPIINLWQVLSAQGFAGVATGFICALFISPLIFIGIGLILDFTQGKD